MTLRHQAGKYNAFRVVLVGGAIVFLLAAALHTGAFGVPALADAMIIELSLLAIPDTRAAIRSGRS